MHKTLATAALALALALSCPARAGTIQIPPAPEPTEASATQESADGAALDGEIPNDAPDSLTEIALDLLALLPSLL